jgi:VWFA-related protein
MKKRSGLFAIALWVLSVTLSRPPSAQVAGDQPERTFRSAVDLVTIQASVRDKRGRVVSGLTAADFEVRDNGQLRQILSLRSDRQSPLTVAILVDMSGSMGLSSKISMARHAYGSVLAELRQGHDTVGLFTFDSALHERHPFTDDLARLKGALSEFEPFGATSLYDATAAAAQRLAEKSGGHKAIIVLTDGLDTSSGLTASEVSGLASSIDVPVFVVATVPSIDQRLVMESSDRAPSQTADLRDLTEWTGGQFVFASTLIETTVVATTLIDQLRQQYVLAIEAGSGPEWRRLDVHVKRPSAIVKARSGYFGG